MTKSPEAKLDSVRQLIITRAQELRLSMADLSKAVGRNSAYVQQYIWRGSPKRLPEAARARLAEVLQIPESVLIDGATPAGGLPAPTFSRIPAADELPIYIEGGDLDPAEATEWTSRPSTVQLGTGGFAVWVRRDNGRVKPGDLLYVRDGAPPRTDDVVVLVTDRKISAIGNLDSVTDSEATIAGKPMPLANANVFKAVAVKFA